MVLQWPVPPTWEALVPGILKLEYKFPEVLDRIMLCPASRVVPETYWAFYKYLLDDLTDQILFIASSVYSLIHSFTT